MRINADLTGHRLLRGAVFPGGARLDTLPSADVLAGVAAAVAEIVDLALHNSVVLDRFTGTSVLRADQVREIGALGFVARASGVDIDARRDHPFHEATTQVTAVTRTEGDVLARFLVRAGEVQSSVALLALLLPEAGPGLVHRDKPRRLPGGLRSGVGLVEGWRGTIAHRLEIGADGQVSRLKIVDPSFLIWPALPVSLTGTIVPDFPVTNKSFNLSYAGNDL